MALLLGFTLLSLLLTSILIIPFIDFLYKVKLRRQQQKTVDIFNKPTPYFDKFNSWKVGTPFGGGILIILVVSVLFLWSFGILNTKINVWELFVILYTFISFGLLGFYDDLKKLVNGNTKFAFFGLRFRHKLLLQCALATVPAIVLYNNLGNSFLFIRGLGQIDVGLLYIPFAIFVIVSFANAFNITDGLDGLASGLMLIALVSFLAIT